MRMGELCGTECAPQDQLVDRYETDKLYMWIDCPGHLLEIELYLTSATRQPRSAHDSEVFSY